MMRRKNVRGTVARIDVHGPRRAWQAILGLALISGMVWVAAWAGSSSSRAAGESGEGTTVPQSPSRRRPAVRPKATPKPTPTPSMRPQAEEVAEQIATLTRFLYVYGKIVNGLELAEEQAKLEKVSAEVTATHQRTRETLARKIQELDEGLATLIRRFQNDPQLQIQYLRAAQAGDAMREASQLAVAGKFHEAGISITTAIERLTETILTMKLP